ncbi:MAG: GyrI-like domain-containing protein [Gammaproteobacteria bacterium]|nr:GyrI-like domain-containing protein [Gammaproteobacteria bacterium]
MQVKVKEVPKLKVAYIRQIGPYSECKKAWDKICQSKNLKIDATTQFIGVCYDDPDVTPAEKIRYDACITVDDTFKAEGDISVQEIAGGKYAIYYHVGPYEKLPEIYTTLCGQWLPQNGYEMRFDPVFDIYKNDPNTTPPEKLETEIYIPVK